MVIIICCNVILFPLSVHRDNGIFSMEEYIKKRRFALYGAAAFTRLWTADFTRLIYVIRTYPASSAFSRTLAVLNRKKKPSVLNSFRKTHGSRVPPTVVVVVRSELLAVLALSSDHREIIARTKSQRTSGTPPVYLAGRSSSAGPTVQ